MCDCRAGRTPCRWKTTRALPSTCRTTESATAAAKNQVHRGWAGIFADKDRLRADREAGRSPARLVTLHRVRIEPGHSLPGPLKPLRVRPAITDGGRSAARKAMLCKTLASPLGARALAIHGQRGPFRECPGSTLAGDSKFGSCYRLSGGTKPLVGFQLVDRADRDGPRGAGKVFRTV